MQKTYLVFSFITISYYRSAVHCSRVVVIVLCRPCKWSKSDTNSLLRRPGQPHVIWGEFSIIPLILIQEYGRDMPNIIVWWFSIGSTPCGVVVYWLLTLSAVREVQVRYSLSATIHYNWMYQPIICEGKRLPSLWYKSAVDMPDIVVWWLSIGSTSARVSLLYIVVSMSLINT